ncbi:MAG: hypothetical protein RMI94_15345 [Bryobacterales bacterium]|nr:hypothetical protein [Bryobacteraceae bacterium]MDW8131925.1 hypothetical protein [Bryobacterales bacterium]
MARAKRLIEIECPCCQARLKIDPATEAVISHEEAEKPRTVESLEAAVARLKGEAARREELFRRSLEAEKRHGEVLERKFEELLRQAKAKPGVERPVRDIDLD